MTTKIALVLILMGVPVTIRDVVRWLGAIDGCRICHVLGQIPRGPSYQVLRWHLRRMS